MAFAESIWTFMPGKKGSVVQGPNTRTLTNAHDGILDDINCSQIAGKHVGDHSNCANVIKAGVISLLGKLVQYPERPGEPFCRYYMKFGECKHMTFCKYNHPKDRFSCKTTNTIRSESLCLHDQQTTILENQFGLPSLVDKATANTTNLVASASSSMTPDEIGEGKNNPDELDCSFVNFTGVCMYMWREAFIPYNFNTTAVKELVVFALQRRNIKYCDIYVTWCGKVLKGDEILSSIPIHTNTHIHVTPRLRGGELIPMEYERMDELIDHAVRDNNNDLFYYVNLPPKLINPYKDTWVTFLSDFSRYIIHQLLQYLNDTFGDPPSWIADISWVPDMWKTYNHSPNNNSTLWTPRYTLDLNSCSHFARNFLNHFGRGDGCQSSTYARLAANT
uniref:C3H1-type domain-containing protein n=1 Tax=Oryza barthii TaxID=65489 RepID=A0A0D3HQX3_9ORYZ